jgi:hypothetical protein
MLLGVLSCEEDGGATDGTDTDTETAGGGFNFASETPEQYTRADRTGMPAVATAVIMSKDMYNQADPADDVAGTFVPEITDIVTALHDALDDDLMGLGLVPCAPDACLMQAAPLVVPDTLKIDPSMPAGFPNGRTLPDPVIDVTLAVVLLDLSAAGQTATTLAEVPVNPPANDVAFTSEFPYLAAPHQ